MGARELKKITELEERLSQVKLAYESVLPIFHAIDRKRLSLASEIKFIENQIVDLRQGQLVFKDPGF